VYLYVSNSERILSSYIALIRRSNYTHVCVYVIKDGCLFDTLRHGSI